MDSNQKLVFSLSFLLIITCLSLVGFRIIVPIHSPVEGAARVTLNGDKLDVLTMPDEKSREGKYNLNLDSIHQCTTDNKISYKFVSHINDKQALRARDYEISLDTNGYETGYVSQKDSSKESADICNELNKVASLEVSKEELGKNFQSILNSQFSRNLKDGFSIWKVRTDEDIRKEKLEVEKLAKDDTLEKKIEALTQELKEIKDAKVVIIGGGNDTYHITTEGKVKKNETNR